MNDNASNAEMLIAEASNPATSPTRLRAVFEQLRPLWSAASNDFQSRLAEAVAGNPNTPPELLMELAHEFPFAVAGNPALPLIPLEQPDLLDRRFRYWVLPLLRAGCLPPIFVQLCLRQERARSLVEAAREHIAVAGEADPEATDWEEEIFTRLERMPPGNLEAIFEMVEYGLIPPALTNRLGFAAVHEPEDPERRAFAARLTRAKRLRARRAVGKAAPCRPAPPGGWNVVPIKEAQRIAADPDLPVEAMRDFAERGKAPMHRSLVRNISAPPDVLRRCLLKSNLEKVIAHPNCDRETFLLAIERHELPQGGLLSPHMTAEELRDQFLYYGEFLDYQPLARRLHYWHPVLCQNPPQWPEAGLRAYVATLGEDSREQYGALGTLSDFLALARLPQSRRTIEWRAAADEPNFRLAMALNPHLPVEWRRQLAEDGNRYVRVVTQARLRDPYRPILGIPILPLAEEESVVVAEVLHDFGNPFLEDDEL